MTPIWSNSLASGAGPLSLLLHLAGGITLGTVYFRSLHWNARLFADAAPLRVTIGLLAARFVLLASVLTLASLEGAIPLLVVTLGVLLARFAVMRRLRRLAS